MKNIDKETTLIIEQKLLDIEFKKTLKIIQNYLKSSDFSKHLKIRIEKWIIKLLSISESLVWKRNRNLHAKQLFQCILTNNFETPFEKFPEENDLSNITKGKITQEVEKIIRDVSKKNSQTDEIIQNNPQSKMLYKHRLSVNFSKKSSEHVTNIDFNEKIIEEKNKFKKTREKFFSDLKSSQNYLKKMPDSKPNPAKLNMKKSFIKTETSKKKLKDHNRTEGQSFSSAITSKNKNTIRSQTDSLNKIFKNEVQTNFSNQRYSHNDSVSSNSYYSSPRYKKKSLQLKDDIEAQTVKFAKSNFVNVNSYIKSSKSKKKPIRKNDFLKIKVDSQSNNLNSKIYAPSHNKSDFLRDHAKSYEDNSYLEENLMNTEDITLQDQSEIENDLNFNITGSSQFKTGRKGFDIDNVLRRSNFTITNNIKVDTTTWNNVYEIRYLLQKLSKFLESIGPNTKSYEINDYNDSIDKCQKYLEDLIKNADFNQNSESIRNSNIDQNYKSSIHSISNDIFEPKNINMHKRSQHSEITAFREANLRDTIEFFPTDPNLMRKSANSIKSKVSNLRQSFIEGSKSSCKDDSKKFGNVYELVENAQQQNANLRKEAMKYLDD